MYGRSLRGNREISSSINRTMGWSASGRRGAVADDARAGEVRPLYSSVEAGEQPQWSGRGVGGAKGGGRGEHEQGPHALVAHASASQPAGLDDVGPHRAVGGGLPTPP